jgi:hypothetical protein
VNRSADLLWNKPKFDLPLPTDGCTMSTQIGYIWGTWKTSLICQCG